MFSSLGCKSEVWALSLVPRNSRHYSQLTSIISILLYYSSRLLCMIDDLMSPSLECKQGLGSLGFFGNRLFVLMMKQGLRPNFCIQLLYCIVKAGVFWKQALHSHDEARSAYIIPSSPNLPNPATCVWVVAIYNINTSFIQIYKNDQLYSFACFFQYFILSVDYSIGSGLTICTRNALPALPDNPHNTLQLLCQQ